MTVFRRNSEQLSQSAFWKLYWLNQQTEAMTDPTATDRAGNRTPAGQITNAVRTLGDTDTPLSAEAVDMSFTNITAS